MQETSKTYYPRFTPQMPTEQLSISNSLNSTTSIAITISTTLNSTIKEKDDLLNLLNLEPLLDILDNKISMSDYFLMPSPYNNLNHLKNYFSSPPAPSPPSAPNPPVQEQEQEQPKPKPLDLEINDGKNSLDPQIEPPTSATKSKQKSYFNLELMNNIFKYHKHLLYDLSNDPVLVNNKNPSYLLLLQNHKIHFFLLDPNNQRLNLLPRSLKYRLDLSGYLNQLDRFQKFNTQKKQSVDILRVMCLNSFIRNLDRPLISNLEKNLSFKLQKFNFILNSSNDSQSEGNSILDKILNNIYNQNIDIDITSFIVNIQILTQKMKSLGYKFDIYKVNFNTFTQFFNAIEENIQKILPSNNSKTSNNLLVHLNGIMPLLNLNIDLYKRTFIVNKHGTIQLIIDENNPHNLKTISNENIRSNLKNSMTIKPNAQKIQAQIPINL
ncbi:uncharacterized protein ASCRUDRAFT_71297 [Ascoidea rubescens DSM 1968]|uniref:Uncharacterized protein n=1 Tax=Ascoidea rubescens DSM 1968 TaxID=1344418 RepID=A0A1D2VE47_9ASCO|nr:hypothetical protein ASCRUDRAFT_71297 [Ascoidea rubescens DSM 1968]ODV59790.1 hypothetical protein ASCRUDRAFT_71297 [Ascoidea rubescens DSM 1968]